jgi:hypothetical protein
MMLLILASKHQSQQGMRVHVKYRAIHRTSDLRTTGNRTSRKRGIPIFSEWLKIRLAPNVQRCLAAMRIPETVGAITFLPWVGLRPNGPIAYAPPAWKKKSK